MFFVPCIISHVIKVCIPTTLGRRQRLQECIRSVQENSGYPHELVVFENSLGGWVAAVREMVMDLGDDPVVVIGDDTLPQPDWLKTLVGAYTKRFPDNDGLVQPDDGSHRGRIASYPMATPRFLLAWIYSGYRHNYADKELKKVAEAMGKYLWVPESKVIHKHYEKHPELFDETYALQKETRESDRLLYVQRETVSGQYKDLRAIPWDKI
mgnify:CR=1 FL=1